jgi:hypothetical protein
VQASAYGGIRSKPKPKGRLGLGISFKGPPTKKNRGPPWWVGGSEYEKGLGWGLFFRYFFIVFLNSPHRETPKNVIKIFSRKSRFWIFGRIFCKTISTCFFLQNVFCSVFELPSLRNTRKRDKTKKVEEKLLSKKFVEILEKVFDMDFLQKYFYGVFELPLPRNAQKRTKKKSQGKKKVGWWVGGSEI